MSSVFPPLTYRDVIKILLALGFSMKPRTGTSHEKWEKTVYGKCYVVTVDKHEQPFDSFLVSSMAKQAGVSKKEFYAALK